MKISRRNFNTKLTQSVLGVTMLSVDTSFGFSLSNQQDTKKLGVALVGLGGYSGGQLAPALVDTQHCYLAGIVTGTPSKEKVWMEKYNIPRENVYNYENFDDIANNDAIDIVYVVLPNSMHAEFCIRAAKAGKHVICEKPMAISVAECDAIIDACKAAGVKLGMGYRLQSEPYTKELKRFAKEKPYGDIHYVSCEAGYISEGNPTAWRLNHALS
jgi:glucose-fructose oxidoreductase